MGQAPDKPDPTGLLRLAGQLSGAGMDGALDATSPPIAYLGDTVADVLTVQRARQQCPDARFLSLAVAPPHLHGPQALERRAAYEARLVEAGADGVLPSTQALEPEALLSWLSAPSR